MQLQWRRRLGRRLAISPDQQIPASRNHCARRDRERRRRQRIIGQEKPSQSHRARSGIVQFKPVIKTTVRRIRQTARRRIIGHPFVDRHSRKTRRSGDCDRHRKRPQHLPATVHTFNRQHILRRIECDRQTPYRLARPLRYLLDPIDLQELHSRRSRPTQCHHPVVIGNGRAPADRKIRGVKRGIQLADNITPAAGDIRFHGAHLRGIAAHSARLQPGHHGIDPPVHRRGHHRTVHRFTISRPIRPPESRLVTEFCAKRVLRIIEQIEIRRLSDQSETEINIPGGHGPRPALRFVDVHVFAKFPSPGIPIAADPLNGERPHPRVFVHQRIQGLKKRWIRSRGAGVERIDQGGQIRPVVDRPRDRSRSPLKPVSRRLMASLGRENPGHERSQRRLKCHAIVFIFNPVLCFVQASAIIIGPISIDPIAIRLLSVFEHALTERAIDIDATESPVQALGA